MFWKKIGTAFITMATSIGNYATEKCYQSKENHVLDLQVNIKDEGLDEQQYCKFYNTVNKLRDGKDVSNTPTNNT